MQNTNLRFIKSFVKHSVALLSVTTWLLMINACASSRDLSSASGFTPVESEDNDEYFIGIGTGRHKDSAEAVLIAKTRALGELSDNIKVRILSVLALIDCDVKVGSNTSRRAILKENIILISSATIRNLEYPTSIKTDHGVYVASVTVKKSKADHLRESARDLDVVETGDWILEKMKKETSRKPCP